MLGAELESTKAQSLTETIPLYRPMKNVVFLRALKVTPTTFATPSVDGSENIVGPAKRPLIQGTKVSSEEQFEEDRSNPSDEKRTIRQ